MSFEKIAQVFDVEHVPVAQENQVIVAETGAVVINSDDSKAPEDEDFDFSRATQYELIEKGKDAISQAMLIMHETQSPRAIEVLSGLLKNVSELNRSLVQMSSDRADVKLKKKGSPPSTQVSAPTTQNIQNNIVFSGSSRDLNKALSELVNASTKPTV